MSFANISIKAIGFMAVVIVSQTSYGQPLFERAAPNQLDQYRSYAARHQGDVISIVISEATAVENRDERSLDKTGNTTSAANLDYGLGGGLGTAIGNATFGENTSSSRGFTGDTEFRSARLFNDQFSVLVKEVMPNGDMVVSGIRKITVQGDVRELRLSGVVRQLDVLPNNTVPSHLVANLQIELKASGAEQAFSKQGWLARKVNKFWPF